MKRLFDFCVAFISIIVFSPFIILIGLLIIIVDWQSPIFIQERLGLNKNAFQILKLKTMKKGKITKLGRILRKTGIDELPQLINIMLGDMSFVGPRPLTNNDVARLEWDKDLHNIRWTKSPGIAGLAQLSPLCDRNISWSLDKKYIEKGNWYMDLKILLASFLILFTGKRFVQKRFYPSI